MAGPARTPKRVALSGPLAEYGPGFAAKLRQLGFEPLSAEHQLRLLAHLSRWMQARGLDVGALTEARVNEFLVERRTTYTALYSRHALRPLLNFLGGLGVLPVEELPPPTPTDLAVEGFERNLLTERGLLPKSAAAQVARIRRFLAGYCAAGGVGQLTTAEVTRALLHEGTDHAASSVKRLGYTIRAFLRYPFATGQVVIATDPSIEGGVHNPEVQTLVENLLAGVAEVPSGEIDSPYAADAHGMASPDGTVAFAEVNLGTGTDGELTERIDAIKELRDQFEAPGVTVELAGDYFVDEAPGGAAESVGMLLALGILFVAFGSVIAAGLPLLTAPFGVGGSLWFPGVRVTSRVTALIVEPGGLSVLPCMRRPT